MITENYIEMCKALENVETVTVMKPTLIGNSYLWLPTLEQLFEKHAKWYRKRYKSKIELSIHLLYLGEFAEIEYFDYKYHSLQEIALGYLYQEKYNKIWNGKKWEMI